MNITIAEQRLIDWQFAGGYNSFFISLFRALAMADLKNRAKLALGFPEEAEAYRRFAEESGYWANVQKRANIPAGL